MPCPKIKVFQRVGRILQSKIFKEEYGDSKLDHVVHRFVNAPAEPPIKSKMEELQDAIEDAQYLSAVSSVEDGPRPVLPWEIPSEEQLSSWKKVVSNKTLTAPSAFSFEWTLSKALGMFLFSSYLKEVTGDYVEINFLEEVCRWKATRGRIRADITGRIVERYLTPVPLGSFAEEAEGMTSERNLGEKGAQNGTSNRGEKRQLPPKSEINEYDLAMEPRSAKYTPEKIAEMRSGSYDAATDKSVVGLCGPVLDRINKTVDQLRNTPGFGTKLERDSIRSTNRESVVSGNSDKDVGGSNRSEKKDSFSRRNLSMMTNTLPEDLFDEASVIVAENVKDKHWKGFFESEQYTKLLNFLWFQDRTVVEEDFFLMRVLGRGGFGLVTACKKGTSGKLYAMKIMNKKRIKIKKSEQLTLNEQVCLADVRSPFVVELAYSFHSQDDVFLILDLMTGGDLSFHLCQKGLFSKKECLYYGARIMLGLQALHDKGYVYRDLKPENCLLSEDGRVKLTDLGLAVKVTHNLHGAAGTRGYWAPEMLRRDKNGKRMSYDHMVDWFSFGCMLAEFISGINPFRSEKALNFGLSKNMSMQTECSDLSEKEKKKDDRKRQKEKAIDCATLEMHPEFDSNFFSEEAADICKLLIDKDPSTRLGANGCKEIMSHPYFGDVNWEEIISDRKRPPFIPPRDVNAASQSEIGTFTEDKAFHQTVLDEKDEAYYKNWDYTSDKAYAAEVIEFLIYERETGKPLLPMNQDSSCCCTII